MSVNQFRTLVLNVGGTNVPSPNTPGEEFVDPTYVARVLPSYLVDIRGLFFGSNPSRATLNLVLRQMLGFIHSSELSTYITDLDPRITYIPFNSSLFEAATIPYPSLADVYDNVLNGLTTDLQNKLFDNEEPYLTFKNLFVLNKYTPYRVAGVFLAMGYKINALN